MILERVARDRQFQHRRGAGGAASVRFRLLPAISLLNLLFNATPPRTLAAAKHKLIGRVAPGKATPYERQCGVADRRVAQDDGRAHAKIPPYSS